MGFWSWAVSDRKWENQALSWKQSGRYPHLVVRTYDDDELLARDAARLLGLGYRITHEAVETRLLGLLKSHTKVTYQHGNGTQSLAGRMGSDT